MAATTTSAASDPTSTATTAASPSSPSRRPHRKHQDSFLLFANASISPNASAEDLSRSSLTERSPEREPDNADNEPLLRRLIMMPLLTISFLLSLFIVERSERARRSSEHPSQRPLGSSFWSTFTLQSWLDPEPYQDPDDTTWQGADGAPKGSPQPKKKRQWYVRKKLRQVGRMQITDALELRGTVMVALLALSVMVILGIGWMGSKAFHGLTGRSH